MLRDFAIFLHSVFCNNDGSIQDGGSKSVFLAKLWKLTILFQSVFCIRLVCKSQVLWNFFFEKIKMAAQSDKKWVDSETPCMVPNWHSNFLGISMSLHLNFENLNSTKEIKMAQSNALSLA
jgi:hypothetical protein